MSDPQQPPSPPKAEQPAKQEAVTPAAPKATAAPAASAAPAAKTEEANANPEAKAARPQAAGPTPEQQKAQMVMIFVIVMFAAAGLLMIPGVRSAIFGDDADTSVQQTQPLPGSTALPPKKLPEKKQTPRNYYPLGNYTQVLGKMRSFSWEDNGVKNVMYYYLYVPPQARQQQGARLPLVAYLHDNDGLANGAMNLLRLGKQIPAYVLLLMIPKGNTWAVPDKYSGEEFGKSRGASANMSKWSKKAFPEMRQSLKDVVALITSLTSIYSIDDRRIYAAGCGEGAIGVYGAAAKYGDLFAGGLIAGGLWSFLDAQHMTKTPLLILHGAKDPQVDPIVANGMSQIINKSGGKASFYLMPDVNCSDGRAMGATAWKWLFSQKKAPVELQP